MADMENINNNNNNQSQSQNTEAIRIMAVPTLWEDLVMEMDEGPGKYPVS